jgi:hypothetical protein
LPDITITPAQLQVSGYSWNAFNGIDITPAILSAAGGDISMGVSLDAGLTGETVRLDRHLRDVAIVGKGGEPSFKEQAREQRNLEAIEAAFANQQTQIDAIEVIVAQLQAVINAQAATAATVAAVQSDLALVNSKTNPVDGLLSADSGGVINISAHARDYADGASVAVNAGSISGFSEGQFVRVYYDDAARVGGAVAYVGTVDEVTQTGARHVVGGVTIPAIGEPPSEGTGATPPGFVRERFELGA